MMWKGIVTSAALIIDFCLLPSAYSASVTADPYAMDVIGVKLGMSPTEVEAVLKAYDPSTRIREIRDVTPSGERAVRVVDAVVGGTDPGTSAQQEIVIFTQQPPARAYQVVRGATFAAPRQLTPDQHLSRTRATFGEPSRPGDFVNAIGIPGTATYAWVYDRHGNKVNADTREGRDLYLLCGDHGFYADPGSYATATQTTGRRETTVSDLMRVAVFFYPSCGVSSREQFIVGPENRVTHLVQDLISDEMALADQTWVQQEKLRARERAQEGVSHLLQALIRDEKALADQGGAQPEKQRPQEHAQPPAQDAASADQAPAPDTAPGQAARSAPPTVDRPPQHERLAAAAPAALPPRPAPPEASAERQDETVMQLAAKLDLAIRRQQTAAAAGDAAAAIDLADMYDQGKIVPKDAVAALAWYRRAAALGSSRAMFRIGQTYDTGHGMPVDRVAAAHWYQQAAALKDGEAEYHLAQLYARGDGVPRDPARADELLRAAASHGFAAAAVSASPGIAKASPSESARSAAAEPATRPVVPGVSPRCGDVLMSQQLEEEITYADRVHLRGCQAAQ